MSDKTPAKTMDEHSRAEHLDEIADRTRATENMKAAAQINTDAEHNMTLTEAVRLYPRSLLFCFVICLAIIMEGYDTALVGSLFAQPQFQQQYGQQLADGTYQIPSKWQSALSGAVQAGSIVGYFTSGVAIERFGYRLTMMFCLVATTAFIFVMFFAHTFPMLIAGSALLGIPFGIIQTLTTTYAAEIAPIALRAYLTSYVNLCWVMGQFISSGVLRGCLPLTTQWAYRIPFGLQWIWPIPVMIGVWFAPDSPWWLVRRGRIDEARTALLGLTSRKNTDYDVDAVVAMIQNTIEMEKEVDDGSRYIDCFRGHDWRRTEITCIGGAAPFLCGNSFAGLTVYFLASAGLSSDASFDIGIGQCAMGFVGTILSWVLMHRFGRRKLYLFGTSVSCIFLLLIGILGAVPNQGNNNLWATGALMMVFTFNYNCCLGPVAYVIVGETPSSQLRNKTVALARVALQLMTFGGSWLNPAIINPGAWDLKGVGAFIWFGPSFLFLVWIYFRLPEMKGRSYGELDDLFYRKVSARKFKAVEAGAAVTDERFDNAKEKLNLSGNRHLGCSIGVKRGHNVVVPEACDVISGGTARTGGHLASALDDRYLGNAKKHGLGDTKLTADDHKWAIQRVDEVAKELSIECEYRALPGYLLSQYDRQTQSKQHHSDVKDTFMAEAEEANSFGNGADYEEGGVVGGWEGKPHQRDVCDVP